MRGSRLIIFLGADDWVRVIGLVSIIQCCAFVVGGAAVLLGRICGHRMIRTDTLYIAIAISISLVGLYLALKLYEGVEHGNPNKLLAWMVYKIYVQFLIVFNFGIYLFYYPNLLNWEHIVGVIVCLLLYGFFLLLVNIHRKELLLSDKVQEQRYQQELKTTFRIRCASRSPSYQIPLIESAL